MKDLEYTEECMKDIKTLYKLIEDNGYLEEIMGDMHSIILENCEKEYASHLDRYVELKLEEDLEENGPGRCLSSGRMSSFDPPDGPEEWEYESRHEILEEELRKEWSLK